MKPLVTKYTFYRNLPIIDQAKTDSDGNKISLIRRLFPLHYQKLRRSWYIEIPGIGLYIHKVYNE